MTKKINNYLKFHPIVKVILLIIVSTIALIVINLFNHESLFNNFSYVYYLIFFSAVILLLQKTHTESVTRLIIGFVASFIFFSVNMFIEDSYVNYSSFIVIAIVSVLLDIIIVACSYFITIKDKT